MLLFLWVLYEIMFVVHLNSLNNDLDIFDSMNQPTWMGFKNSTEFENFRNFKKKFNFFQKVDYFKNFKWYFKQILKFSNLSKISIIPKILKDFQKFSNKSNFFKIFEKNIAVRKVSAIYIMPCTTSIVFIIIS